MSDTVYYLPARKMYDNYWQLVCYNYGANILDRTNTIDFGFKYKTLTQIPEFVTFSESFEQVCDARAISLIALAESRNCNINLMWSGGIDSTVALVSLLRTGMKSRIRVILSKASIGEYPKFYKDIIQTELPKQHYVVDSPKLLLDSRDINLTGEIGDQIFGSAAIFKAFKKEKVFDPYQSYVSTEFLSRVSEQIKKCPIELNTTFDFLWWFNFSMKYQNVQFRLYPSVQLPFGTITHFFDTDEFQLWSLNNPDKKIKTTIQSYKYIAKDYIYSYHQDDNYRDNKLKVGSLQLGGIPYSIDENYRCQVC
jgi:hypothetical protein